MANHERILLLFFSFDSKTTFPSHVSCSPATVRNKTPHLNIYYCFSYSFLMILCNPVHLFHLNSIGPHKKLSHLNLLSLSHACNSKQMFHHIKIRYHKVAFLFPTSYHFSSLRHILLIYFVSLPKLYSPVRQSSLILPTFLSTFYHPSVLKDEE